jgi:hypothetical protein
MLIDPNKHFVKRHLERDLPNAEGIKSYSHVGAAEESDERASLRWRRFGIRQHRQLDYTLTRPTSTLLKHLPQ